MAYQNHILWKSVGLIMNESKNANEEQNANNDQNLNDTNSIDEDTKKDWLYSLSKSILFICNNKGIMI